MTSAPDPASRSGDPREDRAALLKWVRWQWPALDVMESLLAAEQVLKFLDQAKPEPEAEPKRASAALSASWTPERRAAHAERMRSGAARHEPKICVQCGSSYSKRSNCTAAAWARSKYCSVACRSAALRAGRPNPVGKAAKPEPIRSVQPAEVETSPILEPLPPAASSDTTEAPSTDLRNGTAALAVQTPTSTSIEAQPAAPLPAEPRPLKSVSSPLKNGALPPVAQKLPQAPKPEAQAPNPKFPTLPPSAKRLDSLADLLHWRRYIGDRVEELGGGMWMINNSSPLTTEELIRRTNNLRKANGGRPYEIALDGASASA